VIPNARLCKALLDRITDRANIIETGTESYRFRRTLENIVKSNNTKRGEELDECSRIYSSNFALQDECAVSRYGW